MKVSEGLSECVQIFLKERNKHGEFKSCQNDCLHEHEWCRIMLMADEEILDFTNQKSVN